MQSKLARSDVVAGWARCSTGAVKTKQIRIYVVIFITVHVPGNGFQDSHIPQDGNTACVSVITGVAKLRPRAGCGPLKNSVQPKTFL
jgi:hypothetical protein